ncbi:MAG: PrsW family glutamic-type intramembrane protease [bacterium]|nr:PrsW family glutamic-type intramembrane protease [bacterium]
MSPSTLFFSLVGGVLPTLFWLWFWLREDRLHPEPRSLIFLSFTWGMLVVLLALPLEQWMWNITSNMTLVIIGWAILEEVLKLVASYRGALRDRANNEPIDSLIYLITTALGFAALENTLFLAGVFKTGGFVDGLDLGILRFVGATLLHVVSSGALGFFLALGFYKRGSIKKIDAGVGLVVAIILHVLFNLFILKSEGNGLYTLTVFAFVWLAIILLLVGFEKIKQLKS